MSDALPDNTGILAKYFDHTDHLWPLTMEALAALMGLERFREENVATAMAICDRFRFRITEHADGTIMACTEANRPIVKD